MNTVYKIFDNILFCIKVFLLSGYYTLMSIITFIISDLTYNLSRDLSVRMGEKSNLYKLRLKQLMQSQSNKAISPGTKSRNRYIRLSLFLPGLGAGNSYIGRKKRAMAQFIMTIAGFVLYQYSALFILLFFASVIWGAIDAFVITTDAEGKDLI